MSHSQPLSDFQLRCRFTAATLLILLLDIGIAFGTYRLMSLIFW